MQRSHRFLTRWSFAALFAFGLAGGLLDPSPAQAQTYFTTVTERDSSVYVWVNVGYPRVNLWKGPYRVGDTSGYLVPTTTRLQWRNNQGSYEYATLPAGTRWIRVQRGSGRALYFHCYR